MSAEAHGGTRSSWTALAVFLGVALVMAAACLGRSKGDWTNYYVPAALRLQAGEELVNTPYTYPPAFAWLILPLVWVPPLVGRLLWALVNLIAGVVMLRAAWLVSGAEQRGPDVDPSGRSWKQAALALAAALVIAGPFLLDVQTNQQNDLVIAALVLAGCALLMRGRDLAAGCALGLAAGIKCTPLLWAPYLLLKRRYAGACLLLLVAVVVNLLPDLTHPPADGVPRLLAWARCYLMPMASSEHAPGTWCTAIHHNHSLSGVANRLLTQVPSYSAGEVYSSPRAEAISPMMLKMIVASLAGGLLLAAVLAGWAARTSTADRQEKESLEFGLVVCLMLFLSPASSKPHFGILLLPALTLASAVVRGRSGVGVFLVVAGAASLCCNKDLVGAWLYGRVLWYSAVVVVNTAVYLGILYQLSKLARERTASLGTAVSFD